MKSSVTKGTIGVAHCITYMVDQGWVVSLPINDNQPYDLVYDDGSGLKRCSVKYTSQRNKADTAYVVELKSVRPNRTKNTIHNFNKNSVDCLFIFCEDGSRYHIRMNDLEAKTALTLTKDQEKYKI